MGDIEHGIGFQHRHHFAFGAAFAVIDIARFERRVDDGTALFAFFDAGFEVVRLPEGHPAVARIAFLHDLLPKQKNVHPRVVPPSRSIAWNTDGLSFLPTFCPWADAFLKFADDGRSNALVQTTGEFAVARLATERLIELLSSGSIDLEEVQCSCPDGTHGTKACNHGRKCGILRVDGTDVGKTLISEGLAVPYICGPKRCPKMPNWDKILQKN